MFEACFRPYLWGDSLKFSPEKIGLIYTVVSSNYLGSWNGHGLWKWLFSFCGQLRQNSSQVAQSVWSMNLGNCSLAACPHQTMDKMCWHLSIGSLAAKPLLLDIFGGLYALTHTGESHYTDILHWWNYATTISSMIFCTSGIRLLPPPLREPKKSCNCKGTEGISLSG